ncbi:MAG: hypothetical protein AAGK57_00370 [Pseudomonadota bacterium]
MDIQFGKSNAAAAPVWGWAIASIWVFFASALLVLSRVAMVDLPPIYDELYHLLPARSWIESRSLAILDGIYPRTPEFTKLIGWLFLLTGREDLAVARVASIVPGVLLVLLLVAWLRLRLGTLPAVILFGLMLLWPLGIEVSQYTRFYALHGLLFAVGTIALIEATRPDLLVRLRGLALAVSGLAFLAAMSLQMTTAIGGLGLAIFVSIAVLSEPRLRLAYFGIVAAVFLGASLAIVFGPYWIAETVQHYLFIYTWSLSDNPLGFLYYNDYFLDNYAALWPLTPITAAIAIAVSPRIGLACALLVATGFILHSFGGLRHGRYVYYLIPFLFILWSIAIAWLVDAARLHMASVINAIAARLDQSLAWNFRIARVTVVGCLVVAGLFFAAGNMAFKRGVSAALGVDTKFLLGQEREHWDAAPDLAQPWLEQNAVVVTMFELYAIYELGDFDYSFGPLRLRELALSRPELAVEFGEDPRTGRPMIGTLESVFAVAECYPTGVFLAPAGWAKPSNPTAQALLNGFEARSLAVTTLRAGNLVVHAWEKDLAESSTDDPCARLPSMDRRTAGWRLTSDNI